MYASDAFAGMRSPPLALRGVDRAADVGFGHAFRAQRAFHHLAIQQGSGAFLIVADRVAAALVQIAGEHASRFLQA